MQLYAPFPNIYFSNNKRPFMTPKTERRTAPQKSDDQLYALSKNSIQNFIQTERRHDELDRLREVSEQKRVWRNVFIICTLSLFGLIALATMGLIS